MDQPCVNHGREFFAVVICGCKGTANFSFYQIFQEKMFKNTCFFTSYGPYIAAFYYFCAKKKEKSAFPRHHSPFPPLWRPEGYSGRLHRGCRMCVVHHRVQDLLAAGHPSQHVATSGSCGGRLGTPSEVQSPETAGAYSLATLARPLLPPLEVSRKFVPL